jgi:hypothetical protein
MKAGAANKYLTWPSPECLKTPEIPLFFLLTDGPERGYRVE